MDNELYEWSFLEYRHISEFVGKESLIFTNIENQADSKKLEKYGTVKKEKISNLIPHKVCVLSQYAEKILETKDKSHFDFFIFGGILGDNPAKKRTEDIINSLKAKNIKFEERNLGNVQMPTDVAVYVAKKILEGAKFSELKFIDKVEIDINDNECIDLPFRYIVDNHKLIISEQLVEYLKNREEF